MICFYGLLFLFVSFGKINTSQQRSPASPAIPMNNKKQLFLELSQKAKDSWITPEILTESVASAEIEYDQAYTKQNHSTLYLMSSPKCLPSRSFRPIEVYVFVADVLNTQHKRIKCLKCKNEARAWIIKKLFQEDVSSCCC